MQVIIYMVTRVQVLNYKNLKYIDINLKPFVLLVGPNGSGKSNFLDIFSLLRDILSNDCVYAVEKRSSNFRELVWNHQKSNIEIAIELKIPEDKSENFSRARYEIRLCHDETEGIVIDKENLFLIKKEIQMESHTEQSDLFPVASESSTCIITPLNKRTAGWKKIIGRSREGIANYYSATKKTWNLSYQFRRAQSSLAGISEDETRFPLALRVKKILKEGVQFLQLNSAAMRSPCRADDPVDLQMDGSNLPKVINFLKEKHPDYFERWLEHIKSAMPEIVNIGVRERPEDRSLYIYITCDNLELPSWLLSKGTLRLLAHTLIAYLPVKDQIYIIEEPENGIHPPAIESLYQSVSSVYDNQILLVTYSPAILNLSQAEDILCFSKKESGAVDIIRGNEHPNLKGWKKEVDLATLYTSGVLQ